MSITYNDGSVFAQLIESQVMRINILAQKYRLPIVSMNKETSEIIIDGNIPGVPKAGVYAMMAYAGRNRQYQQEINMLFDLVHNSLE